ncbi:hypothetical protein SISNIDRAFT_464706 [Sistotremastrum niveocremeum HHB9708]|uniref:Uncharacterized protein n=1 Tax=Sistotremastrum niveocremeum HHB9708 TaxID=1314777 RepID=A0A164WGR9_9AGAM|nr:hypothetical protein SISNIDRAFT_464706 [Sistotremastrum niveocremeum HHB9708]
MQLRHLEAPIEVNEEIQSVVNTEEYDFQTLAARGVRRWQYRPSGGVILRGKLDRVEGIRSSISAFDPEQHEKSFGRSTIDDSASLLYYNPSFRFSIEHLATKWFAYALIRKLNSPRPILHPMDSVSAESIGLWSIILVPGRSKNVEVEQDLYLHITNASLGPGCLRSTELTFLGVEHIDLQTLVPHDTGFAADTTRVYVCGLSSTVTLSAHGPKYLDHTFAIPHLIAWHNEETALVQISVNLKALTNIATSLPDTSSVPSRSDPPEKPVEDPAPAIHVHENSGIGTLPKNPLSPSMSTPIPARVPDISQAAVPTSRISDDERLNRYHRLLEATYATGSAHLETVHEEHEVMRNLLADIPTRNLYHNDQSPSQQISDKDRLDRLSDLRRTELRSELHIPDPPFSTTTPNLLEGGINAEVSLAPLGFARISSHGSPAPRDSQSNNERRTSQIDSLTIAKLSSVVKSAQQLVPSNLPHVSQHAQEMDWETNAGMSRALDRHPTTRYLSGSLTVNDGDPARTTPAMKDNLTLLPAFQATKLASTPSPPRMPVQNPRTDAREIVDTPTLGSSPANSALSVHPSTRPVEEQPTNQTHLTPTNEGNVLDNVGLRSTNELHSPVLIEDEQSESMRANLRPDSVTGNVYPFTFRKPYLLEPKLIARRSGTQGTQYTSATDLHLLEYLNLETGSRKRRGSLNSLVPFKRRRLEDGTAVLERVSTRLPIITTPKPQEGGL